MPRKLLKVSECFKETYRLRLQGQSVSQAKYQHDKVAQSLVCCLLHAEDGSDMFL
jgi:hypothetical protein